MVLLQITNLSLVGTTNKHFKKLINVRTFQQFYIINDLKAVLYNKFEVIYIKGNNAEELKKSKKEEKEKLSKKYPDARWFITPLGKPMEYNDEAFMVSTGGVITDSSSEEI